MRAPGPPEENGRDDAVDANALSSADESGREAAPGKAALAGPRKPMLSARVRICFCVSMFLGTLLVAVGAIVREEQMRFTPIYRNVTCTPTAVSFQGVSLTPLGFELDVDVSCVNPNPYALKISPAPTPGTVALNSPTTAVATIEARARDVREAEGGQATTSIIVLTARVQLDFFRTLALGTSLLSGTMTVFFEIKMKVLIEPVMFFFLTPMAVEEQVQERCGFRARLVPMPVAGDAVCGKTFAELQVPALGPSSSITAGMTPTVGQEMLQDAERSRDGICTPVVVATLAMGLLLVLLPLAFLVVPLVAHLLETKAPKNVVQPISIGKVHVDSA